MAQTTRVVIAMCLLAGLAAGCGKTPRRQEGSAGAGLPEGIYGVWTAVSAVEDGKEIDVSTKLPLLNLEFRPNGVLLLSPDWPLVKSGRVGFTGASYFLSFESEPKQIQITVRENRSDVYEEKPGLRKLESIEHVYKGVFKLDGDRLTVCLSKAKEFPTDFSPGKNRSLVVYKRAR